MIICIYNVPLCRTFVKITSYVTKLSSLKIIIYIYLFVLTILALFNLNNLCFLVLLVCLLVIFRHSFFANFVGFRNCHMFVFVGF